MSASRQYSPCSRERTSSRGSGGGGGGTQLGGRTFYPSTKDSVTMPSRARHRDDSNHHSSSAPRRDLPPSSVPPPSSSSLPTSSSSSSLPPANLSSFYRDRFGSHSPEEYMNLRLSHMDPKLGKDDIKAILEKEFHNFAPFETKIVRNPHDDQRLAYVNFQRQEAARKIRKTMMGRLTRLLGHRLHVDPAGVIRDQEGKYIPDRYNRALQAERERRPSPSPPPPSQPPPPVAVPHRRPRSPPASYDMPPSSQSRRSHSSSNRLPPPPSAPSSRTPPTVSKSRDSTASSRSSRTTTTTIATAPVPATLSAAELAEWKLNQCVNEGATRTLFIGNMPADIKESEIRRVFERYGRVEDVDIKTPVDTNAAYSFVQFENLEQAVTARYYEQDRPVRPNSSRSKIGYGKPLVSNRLWVGGLGPWTSTDSLVKEFDRYGLIDRIDYGKGADHAFVRFADASAASDACRAMRGFPLGGRDRCILVDFAKDIRTGGVPPEALVVDRKRKRSPPPETGERKRKSTGHVRPTTPPLPPPPRRGPQTPPNSPPPSPPPPPLPSAPSTASAPRRQQQEAATAAVHRQCDVKAATMEELETAVSPCWTGALVLKKSAYAIRLHKLTGDDDLVEAHMRDDAGESLRLHVTQRLPFASQTGLVDRFAATPSDQLAFLLAAANSNATAADLKLADSPSRPLRALVHYLNEKSAAGVVSVRGGAVLYVFPRCDLADSLLRTAAPLVSVLTSCADSCLLLALAKNGLKTGLEANGK